MNKNIKSDKYIWDEFTSSWKHASRALGSWELAAKELRNASDLLHKHRDVRSIDVGNIVSSISKLKDNVDDFIYLTKNIHAELEYEVDRPFYKNVMACVSDAYRINPGKFSLDKTRPDGSVEHIVLTQLLAVTIGDIDLKVSFNKMVDELDEDVPSDTIKEMIIDSIREYYGSEYAQFMTGNVPPVDPSKVTTKELALDSAKAKEYEASRKIFIEYYEMLNPEKNQKLNLLLKNMSKDKDPKYQEDSDNLKYIAYMAEEPYQTLFFEYLSKMKIKDYDYTYTDEGGKVQSSQFWSPLGNNLTLNFDHDFEYGLVDPRGPYTVFFHETGHGVDDLSRPEGFLLWGDKELVKEYRNENNQTLNDVMIEDVRAHLTMQIEATAKEKDVTLTGGQIKLVLDNMMAIKSLTHIRNSDGKVNDILTGIYGEVDKKMEDVFQGSEISGISDAYGGITNNTIRGEYGHGDDYWFNADDSVRCYASTELYAHNFAYNMTGSVKQQELMAIYFPKANEFMKQMADDLYSEIKGD